MNKSQHSYIQQSLTNFVKPISYSKDQLTLYNNRGITLLEPLIRSGVETMFERSLAREEEFDPRVKSYK
jgi:hypothetical protein